MPNPKQAAPEAALRDPATPRVSVGLIVYNGERYVESSIASLLDQTFSDFELIISDNGSTDGTERIARAAAERDSRVRYARSEENHGLAWNLNNALALARGTYFMWAGHDDIHGPEFVARCVAALDGDAGLVYVYGTTYMIDGDGRVFAKEANQFTLGSRSADRRFWEELIVRGGQNFYGMMRRSVLQTIAPHGSIPWAERVLFAELSLHGRFGVVEGPLFFWRRHPDQATAVWDSQRAFAHVLDPNRRGWRTSRAALAGEYVGGYLTAIRHAPIGAGERLRCYARIGRWVLGHVPGLAVRDARARDVELLPVEGAELAAAQAVVDRYEPSARS